MKNDDVCRTCCFTGRRPERLSFPETYVIEWLEEQIREAIKNGYVNFISGMQRGVDIYAAEIVVKLKKEGLPVRLISASAWKGMETKWEQDWIDRYCAVLNAADEICYVNNVPGRKSFFARDCWMIEHSSLLLAVYHGVGGGTKHTMDCASQKGIKIRVMNDESTGRVLDHR